MIGFFIGAVIGSAAAFFCIAPLQAGDDDD
jgi:gas vesicle protein